MCRVAPTHKLAMLVGVLLCLQSAWAMRGLAEHTTVIAQVGQTTRFSTVSDLVSAETQEVVLQSTSSHNMPSWLVYDPATLAITVFPFYADIGNITLAVYVPESQGDMYLAGEITIIVADAGLCTDMQVLWILSNTLRLDDCGTGVIELIANTNIDSISVERRARLSEDIAQLTKIDFRILSISAVSSYSSLFSQSNT